MIWLIFMIKRKERHWSMSNRKARDLTKREIDILRKIERVPPKRVSYCIFDWGNCADNECLHIAGFHTRKDRVSLPIKKSLDKLAEDGYIMWHGTFLGKGYDKGPIREAYSLTRHGKNILHPGRAVRSNAIALERFLREFEHTDDKNNVHVNISYGRPGIRVLCYRMQERGYIEGDHHKEYDYYEKLQPLEWLSLKITDRGKRLLNRIRERYGKHKEWEK